nr:unnamed protein product [Callosobruchus analis]
MELIFGAHNITDKSEDSQIRRTSTEFNIHPDWNWSLKQGDIALVKLLEPVTENEYIKIIRLHSGNETYAGEQGILAGWGITSNNQRTVTPLLHAVDLTIMSNEECAAVSSSYKAFMKPNLLCTSGLEKGIKVGFCKGDSGGPLVVGKDPDRWLQVGVVSFGQSDCEKGLPAVFERVTKYLEWVKKNSDVVVN